MQCTLHESPLILLLSLMSQYNIINDGQYIVKIAWMPNLLRRKY